MRPQAIVKWLPGVVVLAGLAGAAHAEVIQIRIEKLAFAPQQVSAHVGDTVEWHNADFIAHTATARDGSWDVMIAPNASQSVVLKADGVVDYYCKFHPNMTGRIAVGK
jgi:plastocyanin